MVYLKPNQRNKSICVKKSVFIYLLFPLFFCQSVCCFSQEKELIDYFNSSTTDTITPKVRALFDSYGEKDSVKLNWIASKITRKEGKVLFYNSIGEKYYAIDQYNPARYYFTKAVEFAKLTLNKKLIADELSSLGDIYRLQDQNTVALQLIFQAMYLYKELDDKQKLAHTLSLIGDVNRCIEQYADALKYLNDALLICKQNGYAKDAAFCYSSMGGVYQAKKDYKQALLSYKKGLDIAHQLNDTLRTADFNYSIGDLLVDEGKVDEAISYLNEAIKLCIASDDKFNLTYCYIGKSKAYLKQKNYAQSIEEGLKAIKLSEEIDVTGLGSDASEVLYEAYYKNNDFKNAYKYLKILNDNRDSTLNTEQIKEQAQIEIAFKNSFKEKQDSILRSLQQQQREITYQAELKQQKLLAVVGIVGLIMAIIIVFIVYRFYKKEKKSKQIINKQKTLVDEKNKEILDSINYAQKIQQAIVPTANEIKTAFPKSFTILLPKDIVSGDFYWISKTDDYDFVAVVDCTGHGVPGGFMSMLGMAMLNEIVNEKNILEPADILDLLKLKIILALRQSENINENRDGMDLSIVRINKSKTELAFAGANNSLYLMRGDIFNEYKADKHPIGFSFDNTNQQYNQRNIQLEKGDLIYMFTDGYPDQFGGPQGKKFKYKRVEQLLKDIHLLSMDEQQSIILKTHTEWKGQLQQVDDICFMGIKI
jgi:serine phosphatase RsbU (regulator of sigma subunit)